MRVVLFLDVHPLGTEKSKVLDEKGLAIVFGEVYTT
jgi:hypothetical protein